MLVTATVFLHGKRNISSTTSLRLSLYLSRGIFSLFSKYVEAGWEVPVITMGEPKNICFIEDNTNILC
jgi:hypothetical protein